MAKNRPGRGVPDDGIPPPPAGPARRTEAGWDRVEFAKSDGDEPVDLAKREEPRDEPEPTPPAPEAPNAPGWLVWPLRIVAFVVVIPVQVVKGLVKAVVSAIRGALGAIGRALAWPFRMLGRGLRALGRALVWPFRHAGRAVRWTL
ncbi:MAG: hypothetical protein HOU01_26280, partial [Streptomycetaceae bacterium]|nr:hypothetical protein [Streptomycetaceae bacterium]